MTARSGTLLLPLPVARLARRSHNAKSVRDRHDTAWYAWEVSVRVGVCANPPADVSALVRGSLGQWAAALNVHARPLSDPALLALFAHFTEHGLNKRSERRSIGARELVDASVAYRNRVLGHGSVRAGRFYDEACEVLLAGLQAAWSAELFVPLGDDFVYAESVTLAHDGTRRARLLDLAGETPLVIDPRGTPVSEAILPRRLYLRRGAAWKSLHPWLLFLEEGERVACFSAFGRRAEFLDYASGEIVAARQLEELFPGVASELEILFGRRASEAASERPDAEAAPDPKRFGEYEILGKLGEGAMGVVYLARQQALKRLVALKMLPTERARDAVSVARFKREVQALSRCEHPNVVKILAFGEAKGTLYYAMEYVEGSDLRRVAARLVESDDFDTAVSSACEEARSERSELFAGLPEIHKPAPVKKSGENRPRQLARFFRDAARGLAHLHAQGILHRDISPGNVMVTHPEGRAVVMDLGLARMEGASVSLTKDKGQILGTLRYIAPEQLQRSLLSVDERADVYSLGATLYELLADRPFFDGETEARLIEQVIREEPLKLSSVAPRVPADLASIVGKATEKDPALRYDKAEALANDLDNFLAGHAITARPPTPGYLLKKWVQRHKELSGAIAAALVVIVGGTAGFLVTLQATNRDLAAATTTAQENEKAALVQKKLATDKANDVLKLSAFQTLEDLTKEAEGLWPAEPRLVGRYREWMRQAEKLTARVPDFQASLAEIEARALPQSEEERAQERATHPRARELEEKRAESVWTARMLGKTAWPSELEVEAELAKESLPADARGLNSLAWPLVDPDKPVHGSEVKALLLARRAVAAANAAERGGIRDSLAWAFFKLARFDEAVAAEKLALEEVDAAEKGQYEGFVAKLESAVKLWRDAQGRVPEARVQAAQELANEVAELEAEVAKRRDWRFAEDVGGEEAGDRWWHEQLVKLVTALEAFGDETTGLVRGVSEAHGWGVGRRLDFAASVEERTVSGSEAARRWAEALAAIASSPKYGGLKLTPQLGLLPIGADPASGLWEFWHVQSGEEPKRGADGKLVLAEKMGIVLVLMPGGTFTLGAQKTDKAKPNYDERADNNETPYEVTLDAYFLSKYEMTQGQWEMFEGSNPSQYRKGNYGTSWNRAGKGWTALHPVEQVSWTESHVTMVRLGLILPTEAQWERGCRGGRSTVYWSGDEAASLADVANVADQYAKKHGGGGWSILHEAWDDGNLCHAEVGSYRANELGLHDTHGNILEWCQDWYGSTTRFRAGDGEREVVGAPSRVYRGGSFGDGASDARSANRGQNGPESQSYSLGLRPARAASTP